MTSPNKADGFAARRWDGASPQNEREGFFREFSDHVLRKKANTEGEFFINFFERCNLKCGFCYQKHDDWTGVDQIPNKIESLVSKAKALGARFKGYQINMMGGELFMDDVPDQAFDQYYDFVVQTSAGLKELGKYARYHFVTNLIFTKTDRLKSLLDRLKTNGYDVPICISYDFSGRFTAPNLELFKKNVETFFAYVKMVSIVLTRQNIDIMLGRKPETVADIAYLKSLYERGMYTLFDYFSPQHNAELFSPSDEDIYEAFIWLIEHFPKSGPVHDMFDKKPQLMSCREDQIVQPDGQVGRCRILVDKRTLSDFEDEPDNFDNGNMQTRFVKKMGCLNCEYFDRCGLGCFLLHDFKKRPQMDSCLFRKLYQKIDTLQP